MPFLTSVPASSGPEPTMIVHPTSEENLAGTMLYDLELKHWFVVLSCQTCAARNPSLQTQLDSFVKENPTRFAKQL